MFSSLKSRKQGLPPEGFFITARNTNVVRVFYFARIQVVHAYEKIWAQSVKAISPSLLFEISK